MCYQSQRELFLPLDLLPLDLRPLDDLRPEDFPADLRLEEREDDEALRAAMRTSPERFSLLPHGDGNCRSVGDR